MILSDQSRDTIFAPATAPGRAGVAVLRISGPRAGGALEALAGRLPSPRRATLADLRHPASGERLDQALALWFPAPASFTGEDVAELQIHGGPAILAALLEALGGLEGLRLATPGEFTRRAFDKGKLDLTQVEGLADLLAAETEAQRRAALRQLDGALGEACRGWSKRVSEALAFLEASIDFIDDELPPDVIARMRVKAAGVGAEIAAALAQAEHGERLRLGWRVAILGAPNAGKSTLLNALTQRRAAIVSDRPGTTRDAIEAAVEIDGLPVTLIDTAGLRETEDEIEREGVTRARELAAGADLRIFLLAPDAPPPENVFNLFLNGDLVLANKADLGPLPPLGDVSRETIPPPLPVSLRDPAGAVQVAALLKARILAGGADPSAALLTRARHKAALSLAAEALARFDDLAAQSEADDAAGLIAYPELAAEELRAALAALGEVTGRVGVEALLDIVFSEFCLGK
ncbi:tRNA uridine-5-carboxymethylaminomethyl(34) synthesis GTPase MnmE [Neomegalonema sp.]|uniref:tRNA uridine-5-carboxymethylaminomethyl(34) synthesis GTPase MnmE n=1 Tax=Neomegalonema sp. TaxID=2039713 RepID=UPI0026379A83|nr:tRNA uridine-5-carboxymethylaminomethyl(34) synthesis GTPase MnmE [Neomegalonema sp.]MDD2867110.1 tRNA uridine-5-carboxymethylaminomethyl(34) synthesis GTPase MnmE [Neomegalonema sp.]